MLNYGTKTFSSHRMNSVLVESRDDFKVFARIIIRDRFVKKDLLLLVPPNFTTNTQACAASIQVYSVAKSEEIKNISYHTFGPIKVKVNRTDDPMVVLRSTGTQQSSSNIVIRAA